MSGERLDLLTCGQGDRSLAQALADLWMQAEGRGWFATPLPRIVVQVGQRWRSALVVETAASLARLLANRAPSAQVETVDSGTEPFRLESMRISKDATSPVLAVSGITARQVRIPEWWLESFFLITVTGAGPDPMGRISAVLDAQAEPLRRVGNSLASASLAYEAHRLFASDLVVACGTTRRDDPTTEAYWFVSPSDIAAEMALMRATGCEPSQMPYIKTLARHELLPKLDLKDIAPTMTGYVTPSWQVRLNAVRATIVASRTTALQDLESLRHNLQRLPLAVRRRLAMRKRSTG